MVVDDTGQPEGDVVFGHANLLWNLGNLDLDVDLDQALGQRVDLDETRVNGAVETAEFGDETNISLIDTLVGVRADDATGNGSHGTDDSAKGIDHLSVPAGRIGLRADSGGIGALEIILLGRLDGHFVGGLEADGGLIVGLAGGRALAIDGGRHVEVGWGARMAMLRYGRLSGEMEGTNHSY